MSIEADAPVTQPDIDRDWYEEMRDAIVRGRRIRYVDTGPADGVTLVLLHGMGANWLSWRSNLAALAGAEHRVVALDLPGFGRSEPLPQPFAFGDLVRAVQAFVERIVPEAHVLVGHSMGGMLAIHLAAARPEHPAGLVLVDSGGVALSPARVAQLERVIGSAGAAARRPIFLARLMRLPHIRWLMLRGAIADPVALDPNVAFQLLRGLGARGLTPTLRAAAAAAREESPSDVGCPVRIIWGEGDRLLPVSTASRLAAALGVTDASVSLMPNVGHCPMLERPREFERLLSEFVATLDG